MVDALKYDFMGESTMPRFLMVRKPTRAEFRRLNELIDLHRGDLDLAGGRLRID